MGFLLKRSLKTLTSSKKCNLSSNNFFTLAALSSSSTATAAAAAAAPLSNNHHHHFLFSNSKSLAYNPSPRFTCPLFLSSPPWNLTQSATPLHHSLNLPTTKLPSQPPPPIQSLLNPGSQGLLNAVTTNEFRKSSELFSSVKVTDSYLNLPNYISFARLLSGPLLGWMITQEMYLPAFVGLVISGATDWLDGYMARKMGIDSVVGSYLDPLADKVLIGCVALAMVERSLLHPGLVGLVVLRDVALVGGAVYKRGSSLEWQWKSWTDFFNLDGTRPYKVEPLFLSKVNTVFQLVLVAAALLQPEFGNEESQSYITYLSWLVALTTVGSTVGYGVQHLAKGSISTLTKNRL